MALYNEILVGRFNRFFQKHLGMKGGPPAPQLSSDLQPALAVHSDDENLYLEGWESFALSVLYAASVGNVNEFRLRNPNNSNVIALLEKVMVATVTVTRADVQYGQPGADLGTSQQANVRSIDSRGRPGSTLIASSAQPAAQSQIGTNIWVTNINTGVPFDVIFSDSQRFVLLPNSALQVSFNVANIASFVAVWWRERFLEEGERT
jgi:hypothetical protein